MQLIGPYEIRGELGRGAMAVVWRGYDPAIGRDLALKEPKIDDSLDPATREELVSRFIREGKTAGRLNHPGIVTIYNADVYDGRPVIAMELIEGETLSELMRRGRLPLGAAVSIAEQLLDALAYAHERGVVHRDVKPDNVFITNEGRVKLADFGIAHAGGGTALTQAGTVMGTPGYMAPEQVRGEAVDARADLFSVGVMLFETLAGENPFMADGAHPTTIMYRVLNEPLPDVRTALPEATEGLAATIALATAKDSAQRFASAADMRQALLGEVAVAMPKAAKAAGGKRKGLLVAAGVLAVAVVGVLVASVLPGPATEVASPDGTSTAAGASTQKVDGITAQELLVVAEDLRGIRAGVELVLDDVGELDASDGQLHYPDHASQGMGLLDTGAIKRSRDEAAKGASSVDPLIVEASLALQKQADALLVYHTAIEDEYGGGEVPYQLGLARYYDWYATSLLSGDQARIDAVRTLHQATVALPQGLDLWFPYVEDQGPPVITLSGSGPDTGYTFSWDYLTGVTVAGEMQDSPTEELELFWMGFPEWTEVDIAFPERLSGMQVYSYSGSSSGWWDWADPRITDGNGFPTRYPAAVYELVLSSGGSGWETLPMFAVAPAGEGALR